ncbi:MAG: biotin--[acetyl-CoA-carboxylase] ligase [Chloroflexaceae bacterium]|nr:biotin--[acetyl-CoA-carboxylase] ligase [Chloroflexaceae bacterium]
MPDHPGCPDPLAPPAILHGLGTTALPRSVRCYPQVGSTMDVAREHLQDAPPDVLPMLVLADEQTDGRGRMQRPWWDARGKNLLFSLAMRPLWLRPAQAPALVWMAGVALCEGIAETTGLWPRLKWPNDVLLDEKKVAGLLLESGSSEHAVTWAVLGCGLNVNAGPPPDILLRSPSTCLADILGCPVLRLPLVRSLLVRLDTWYTRLQNGEHARLFGAWRALLATLGQEVQVETATGVVAGCAEDVEPSGALRLRDAAGATHLITAGDVFLV